MIPKSLLRKKWFLIVLLVWVLIYFFVLPRVINIEGRLNKRNCEEEQKVKSEFIKGVVTEKFKDNRDIKYFKYYNGQDTLLSNWVLLRPSFYEFLEIGDSVLKEKGSLLFEVKRGHIDTTQVIDFDCE